MKRIMTLVVTLCVAVLSGAQNLTLLHMNDTHSHVDPQRTGEYVGRGGAIEQAAFIDSVRIADGRRNVLLLHGGDFSQGTSYFTELGGDIEIDLLNAMGFDVVTIGNHEFDNGPEELARRLGNLKADVVCANYDFSGTALEPFVQPYTIVRKAGLKIGIIGVLTDIGKVVSWDIAKNFTYLEPAPIVGDLASFLKDDKKCDLVICLSHLGYTEDKELASSIRNVDVIVGGHSHTLLHDKQLVKDLDGKDVVIVQDWKWGLDMGILEISY